MENETMNNETLTEARRAFGANYEDLIEEVMDALAPLALGVPKFNKIFKQPAYDNDEVIPDYFHTRDGFDTIKIVLKYADSFDRAKAVAHAFGLDYEQGSDNVAYIFVPEGAEVMPKFVNDPLAECVEEDVVDEEGLVENLTESLHEEKDIVKAFIAGICMP